MTRRFSRLKLTFLNKDSPGRPSSENLFVDVVLGEDDRIVGKWELSADGPRTTPKARP